MKIYETDKKNREKEIEYIDKIQLKNKEISEYAKLVEQEKISY